MKYVLFDLDGTLTDPKEGITKSVQYALKKFGIEADCDDLLCFIGPPLEDSFVEYYGFEREKAKLAVDYYRERFGTIGLFENSVIDGIPEVLKQLKDRNMVLAVATSKPTVFATQICDKYDLSKYFDVILGSELDGTRVKKHEVIEDVLQMLHCPLEEAIMVGDRKHDIIGAKAVGIKSIGVEFGYAEEGELKEVGADFIIDTPAQLLECL